jgi:dimethylglycine dehydrogenase
VRFWAEDGTPQGFGHELFADDLERIEENMMRAIDRVPVVGEAGIKRVINGPMIWSPDASALFGPVPELTGYFCCNGIIPGFSQNGGLGKLAAEWMVEGEPSLDMFGWDLARFGALGGQGLHQGAGGRPVRAPLQDPFPGRGTRGGRPVRTRPAYAMQAMGAKFGLNYGWEHPLFFDESTSRTARASRASPGGTWWAARRGCCARSGIIDISNFAKYRVRAGGRGLAERAFRQPHAARGGAVLPDAADRQARRRGGRFHRHAAGAGGRILGHRRRHAAERFHQRFFRAVPCPRARRSKA